jgi:hypothetical protein
VEWEGWLPMNESGRVDWLVFKNWKLLGVYAFGKGGLANITGKNGKAGNLPAFSRLRNMRDGWAMCVRCCVCVE